MVTLKFGDAKGFHKFLLKCESVSESQDWNALDTPEMLCMLISKVPGQLMDRWNRTVQAIRRKQRREPDQQDLIQFVEEETTIMNDPLFSREALHEYTKGPEKQNQRRLRQMKSCFVKADKKKDACESSELKSSLKCQFCDGNHDLDDCQFYNELSVEDRSSFLKNKLCYGCYREIMSTHTARTCNNRRVCKVCHGKHPSGLHGYKMKRKKTSDNDTDTTVEQEAIISNCAGIKNAATAVGEVISMCVVPVKLKHCNSQKEVKTFALQDSCSQGVHLRQNKHSKNLM